MGHQRRPRPPVARRHPASGVPVIPVRKAAVRLLLAIALLAAVPAIGVPPAHGQVTGPTAVFIAFHSSKVMDVGGAAPAAPVVQRTFDGRLAQQWVGFELQPGSNVFVLFNRQSAMVLDVAGASTDDGAPVVQWPWHGGLNQLWYIARFEGAPNVAVAVNLHSGKVAQVAGASQANDAPLVQGTWTGALNQIWYGAALN